MPITVGGSARAGEVRATVYVNRRTFKGGAEAFEIRTHVVSARGYVFGLPTPDGFVGRLGYSQLAVRTW